MNPTPDPQSHSSVDAPHPNPSGSATLPANWREAVLVLIAARLAIIELEGKHAARLGAQRALSLAAMAVCVLFAWALLLAGGIAVIARATHWPWGLLALAAAVLHLLAALALARAARAAAPPLFPVTRAEFHHDREWIESLQQTPKSNG